MDTRRGIWVLFLPITRLYLISMYLIVYLFTDNISTYHSLNCLLLLIKYRRHNNHIYVLMIFHLMENKGEVLRINKFCCFALLLFDFFSFVIDVSHCFSLFLLLLSFFMTWPLTHHASILVFSVWNKVHLIFASRK